MPKVSVIVPVYNVEKYLERCINSILNQTYTDFELLLADDGSTDRSSEICDSFAEKDSRVKVFHLPNGGQGAARNKMLEKASGEYVLFVDSDDYISRDLLDSTVPTAEEKNYDLIIFSFKVIDESGNELAWKDYGVEDGLLLASPEVWNKLIRKSVIDKNFGSNFFPSGIMYEDLIAIKKLFLYVKSYTYLDKAYYYYLIRNGSTMRNGDAQKTVSDRISATNQVVEFYKSLPNYKAFRKDVEWIAIMDGFLSPAREILHFKTYDPKYMSKLKRNLNKNIHGITAVNVFCNKYFLNRLPLRDKLVLIVLYFGGAPILKRILERG